MKKENTIELIISMLYFNQKTTLEKNMEAQLMIQLIIDMTTVNHIPFTVFIFQNKPIKIMENCRKFIEQLVKSIHSAIIKSVDLVDGRMVEGKRGGDKDEFSCRVI